MLATTQAELFTSGATTYTVRRLSGGELSMASAEPLAKANPEDPDAYISCAVFFSTEGAPTRVEVISVTTLGMFKEAMEKQTYELAADGSSIASTRRNWTVAYPSDPTAWMQGSPDGEITWDSGDKEQAMDPELTSTLQRIVQQYSEAHTAFQARGSL